MTMLNPPLPDDPRDDNDDDECVFCSPDSCHCDADHDARGEAVDDE